MDHPLARCLSTLQGAANLRQRNRSRLGQPVGQPWPCLACIRRNGLRSRSAHGGNDALAGGRMSASPPKVLMVGTSCDGQWLALNSFAMAIQVSLPLSTKICVTRLNAMNSGAVQVGARMQQTRGRTVRSQHSRHRHVCKIEASGNPQQLQQMASLQQAVPMEARGISPRISLMKISDACLQHPCGNQGAPQLVLAFLTMAYPLDVGGVASSSQGSQTRSGKRLGESQHRVRSLQCSLTAPGLRRQRDHSRSRHPTNLIPPTVASRSQTLRHNADQ